MKRCLLTICLFVCSTVLFAQTSTVLTTFQGVPRRFIVHLPSGYAVGQHLPMVINMHGYGSNDGQQELYTQMDATADANHFIVIYPNGIDSAWNVGWVGAMDAGINDVGFISHVIDTMIQLYSIDSNRVYACGMSNGGFMSHKLACDLSNRIAAIASVAGTFSDSMVSTCNPTRKIPVMQIHGTLDPTVPYGGFTGGISVEATINKWLGYNQCTATNDTILVPDVNTNDGTTVQRIDYRTCADSTQVLFMKVIGGGHTWPGALIDISAYGNTNHDISASNEIWNFFKQYSLTGLVGIENVNAVDAAVKVYPNPFSSQVKVESATLIQRLSIFNLVGEIMLNTKVNANETVLDLSSFSDGVYFLKIEGVGFVVTRKIIKD